MYVLWMKEAAPSDGREWQINTLGPFSVYGVQGQNQLYAAHQNKKDSSW